MVVHTGWVDRRLTVQNILMVHNGATGRSDSSKASGPRTVPARASHPHSVHRSDRIKRRPSARIFLVTRPKALNNGLRGTVTEIDYDEIPILVLDPAPRDQILIARIIRPARALAKRPLTLPEHRGIDGVEEPVVENLQWFIGELRRTSTEKDRQSYLSSLELAFMEQSRSRQGSDGYRSRPLLRRRECRGGAGFIVVFDEPKELRLVSKVGAEMSRTLSALSCSRRS